MTKIVAPRRDEAMVSRRGSPNLRFANTIEELVRGFNALTFNADELVANEDAYTATNVIEDRSFDANDAAGDISVTYDQAEIENLRDSILEISDVLGTLIADLKKVGIIP